MLVLSRKNREAVVIGGHSPMERMLKITVLHIKGGSVKLGFEVNDDVPIQRLEVWERMYTAGHGANPAGPAAPAS